MKRAWRDVNFAIIDDGTLYGRELAEAVRFRMEEDNLKPVFADTYRPQLDNQVALIRRLRKAGATHVFVGGDASDAAIIGADAARIGIPLTLAGGTAFLAPASAGTLADGTILVALPAWPDVMDRPSGENAVAVSAAHPGNSYLVPAYAALQIALAIFEGRDPADGFFFGDLLGRTFDTVLGPVSFDGNGDVSRNLFRIFVIEDGEPVLAGSESSTGSIQ
jgi:branched-chain amino acid transport system substrate-binding protein